MAEDHRDVLIYFKQKAGGSPCAGESVADLVDDDDMTDGFKAGCFSNITDFTIGIGHASSAGGGAEHGMDKKKPPAPYEYHEKEGKFFNKTTGKYLEPGKGGSSGSEESKAFLEKGAAGLKDGNTPKFKSDLEKVSISKYFDITSLWLFYYCNQRITLDSVVIVRRKAVAFKEPLGTRVSHPVRGYLRFDFKDVLITDVDWSEDDVIKESVQFICRKLDISYYTEEDDGYLAANADDAHWSFLANA